MKFISLKFSLFAKSNGSLIHVLEVKKNDLTFNSKQTVILNFNTRLHKDLSMLYEQYRLHIYTLKYIPSIIKIYNSYMPKVTYKLVHIHCICLRTSTTKPVLFILAEEGTCHKMQDVLCARCNFWATVGP